MSKKTVKAAALAALLGTVFQFGGCWGTKTWWGRVFWDTVLYAGQEFVLDNDGVFDLFEDDGNNVAGR